MNYIFRFIYALKMYRRVKIKFLIVTTIEENLEWNMKGELKGELLVLLMRFFINEILHNFIFTWNRELKQCLLNFNVFMNH